MDYYMLSVWKKNGQRSYSQCCSTSENREDLDYNEKLYCIQDDEMYVISQIENGYEQCGGGKVSVSWFRDNHHVKFQPDDDVIWKVNTAINEVLKDQLRDTCK